jgi:hypothetical protein
MSTVSVIFLGMIIEYSKEKKILWSSKDLNADGIVTVTLYLAPFPEYLCDNPFWIRVNESTDVLFPQVLF